MHRMLLPLILLVAITLPAGDGLFQPDPQTGLVASVLDTQDDANDTLETDDCDAADLTPCHTWPTHRVTRNPTPAHDGPASTQNNKALIRAPPHAFS